MTDISNSPLAVSKDTKVTLFFSLSLEDGQSVDSNFDDKPATFTVGDGNLLTGFENVLMGLCAGDEQVFEIAPEHGFGEHNPSNVQTFKRDDFGDEETLEVGLVQSFSDASGAELAGVVTDVSEDGVVVDFNHPLAGHTITFKVKIMDVSPAVMH